MIPFLLILLPSLLVPVVPTPASTLNQSQLFWKPAINNYAPHIRFGGCSSNNQTSALPEFRHNLAGIDIPSSFDAREHWPNCPSINNINNQGSCASCWAFGSTEVMTDRVCIHSDGEENFYFSMDDLVSCCPFCGGCGGVSNEAYPWMYWKNNGIVSGGPYGSRQGCRPYEISPDAKNVQAPACIKACESGYPIPYQQDLHFGKTVYAVPSDVGQIQMEIMKNGPVATRFTLYTDFYHHYTEGIYTHKFGDVVGGHTVKMLGWGSDNGVDYWLLANSWGPNWGENGFFRFVRGQNECGIEDSVHAGIPA